MLLLAIVLLAGFGLIAFLLTRDGDLVPGFIGKKQATEAATAGAED
jgi:hypothetical protein